MNKKIMIFGASGCGNVGDDLIGLVLTNYLQKKLPKSEVILEPQNHHQDIAQADIVIVGGGGLIYDYDINNVHNYCSVVHRANSFRIPVYFMGMGVQHVFSAEAKKEYQGAINIVKHISTRGNEDTEFISNELKYPVQNIITSRDVVFLYDDVFGKQRLDYTFKINTNKPKLALSLADWRLGDNYSKIEDGLKKGYDDYRAYLEKTLPSLSDVFDVKIICQASEDIELSNEILGLIDNSELIKFDSIQESSRLIDVYSSVDFVITNRYHGLIAAIISNKPVIGAAFSTHKQQRLIRDSFPSLDDQFFIIGDFVKKDILGKILDSTFRDTIKSARRSEYRKCVSLTRQNIDLVARINSELKKI